MKKPSLVVGGMSFLLVLLSAFSVGCDSSFNPLDPTAVVKAPAANLTSPIYSQASTADETQELPPGATFPAEDDLKYVAHDYIIGALDVVDISVLDLFSEGLETVLRRQVSESGNIDLPMLPATIKAEGLTSEQLREAIAQAYSPDILKNATVSVSVVLQRQNTFSILGAIARPGAYNMVKRDMRLMDAIAAAGGQSQTNISYIYVFRQEQKKAGEPSAEAPAPEDNATELPPLPTIPTDETPKASGPASAPATAPSSPSPDDLKNALPGSRPMKYSAGLRLAEMVSAPSAASKPAATTSDVGALDANKSTKWVQSSGGRSTQVTQTAGVAGKPSGEGAANVTPKGLPTTESAGKPSEDLFGWKKIGGEGRIIAIDLQKLNAGDPRMNIIIRDNDIINVPLLEQGEFYIMGEVQRPGVYSLTGRKVTVKMGVAAAGNLGPMAWPKNSVLIRRLNEHQEQMIPINVEDIFTGKEPDIYLKANDVVAVGTNAASPFLAVIRNAFRLTYGFGFIYDRNFGAGYDPSIPLDSRRWTRW